MEEKNRNHGPTEEELSDSVKDAYTSVYVLDPMAEDFDDEDDLMVEIVGASAVNADGETEKDSKGGGYIAIEITPGKTLQESAEEICNIVLKHIDNFCSFSNTGKH